MKRRPANLSESLCLRLNSYALAASAAGVGMLALTTSAEAKIVYTAKYKVILPNQGYQMDLNHDGIIDLLIRNSETCGIDNTCTSRVSAIPYGNNGIAGTPGTAFTPAQAYALRAGARIGPKLPFAGVKMAGNGQTTAGNWFDVTNRYLGVKLQVKNNTHYGWARLTVKNQNEGGFTVTLTGYAYETIANKAIVAGKTKGPDVVTVRPTSLGHLAQGASGISAWRGTNSVAAVH